MALTYPKKYKKDINLKIQDTDINSINTKAIGSEWILNILYSTLYRQGIQ